MKKFSIFIFVLISLFNFIYSESQNECLKIAEKIYRIQNEIIKNSYIDISPGTWAKHKGTMLVYLGEKVSPKTGLKLKVIEVQGRPAGQIWFKITEKPVFYKGKKYVFLTLEPMEGYAVAGGRVFYISKAFIETYMAMNGPWSHVLYEGQINDISSDCKNEVIVKDLEYQLPSGKKYKAYMFVSKTSGGKVIVSPHVPFGIIKSISATGEETPFPNLVSFGFSGVESLLSDEQLKNSSPIPMMIFRR